MQIASAFTLAKPIYARHPQIAAQRPANLLYIAFSLAVFARRYLLPVLSEQAFGLRALS